MFLVECVIAHYNIQTATTKKYVQEMFLTASELEAKPEMRNYSGNGLVVTRSYRLVG